jgi:hypothetical protein
MARGWESKDVESQLAGKENMAAPGKAPGRAPKTMDQLQKDRERANIELSRKHVLNDLESATNPNHKKTLEAALAHLDQQLQKLD